MSEYTASGCAASLQQELSQIEQRPLTRALASLLSGEDVPGNLGILQERFLPEEVVTEANLQLIPLVARLLVCPEVSVELRIELAPVLSILIAPGSVELSDGGDAEGAEQRVRALAESAVAAFVPALCETFVSSSPPFTFHLLAVLAAVAAQLPASVLPELHRLFDHSDPRVAEAAFVVVELARDPGLTVGDWAALPPPTPSIGRSKRRKPSWHPDSEGVHRIRQLLMLITIGDPPPTD